MNLRWTAVRRLVCSLILLLGGTPVHAGTQEAINNLGLYASILTFARACGAPTDQVEKAADFMAARFVEQQPSLASKVSKASILNMAAEGADVMADVAKRDKGIIMDEPCSHWRSMLDNLVEEQAKFLDFK